MKTQTLSTTLITLGFAWACAAAAPIGQVVSLQGQASAVSQDGASRALAMKSPIHLNDRVQTEAEAKVQIMLSDDAIILVGPESEMTFDEYVYSPDVPEENNASMSLMKGLFRVITSKITDLNPKRFKVKSNMATIGIRGCELGFDIREDGEEIQIVRIPEKKEIVVENASDAKDVMTILQQGVLITAKPGDALARRALTARDIKRIVDATTPVVTARRTVKGMRGGDEGPEFDTASEKWGEISGGDEVARGEDIADSDVYIEDTGADIPPSVVSEDDSVVAAADSAATDGTVNTRTQTEIAEMLRKKREAELERQRLEELQRLAREEAERSKKEELARVEEKETEVAGSTDPVLQDPAGSPQVYPVLGKRVSTPRGGGTDWSWGTWERDDVVGRVGGVDETRTVYGATANGSVLSPAEFQAIATTGIPRLLTGRGIAGAGVSLGNQGALLTGTSDINVLLGGNVTPNWNGTFSLSGTGGERLNFSVNSALDGSGALKAGASAYSLNAFGGSHGSGSLTVNSVDGKLVGSPANGVTGSIGTFKFVHGATGPKVDGVFGADVN